MSSDVKDIRFGTIGSFSLAKGLFVHEAHSPDPPVFMVAKSKRRNKNAAPTDKPEEEFQEVDIQNYRRAFVSNPVLPWGLTNRWPQLVDEEACKCDTLEAGLKRISDQLYGQGFYLYKEVFEGGERKIEEVNEPQLWDMLYNSGFYEYYEKACKELPRWGNIFPVYLLNKPAAIADKQQIVQLKLYDTPWCRLERPHWQTGKIEAIYVSAQWNHGLVLSDKNMVKDTMFKKWVQRYELLDENTYMDQLEHTEGVYTWTQHLKFHTSGKAYGRAPWHSAYENRWTALSAAVPEMKMRLYEYAMTINYIVYVDEEYWAGKYGDNWNDWDTSQKQEKIIEKQKEIEMHLAGSKNAWKTLFASKMHDDNGNDIKSIIIEVINNTLKEGNYIPDSQIADTHILQSLGVDPSLMGSAGNSAGSKQSAGSGSNIREASLSLNATLRPDREKILTPYYIMRDFNFPALKDIKIGVRDYVINTLDGRSPASGSEATTK